MLVGMAYSMYSYMRGKQTEQWVELKDGKFIKGLLVRYSQFRYGVKELTYEYTVDGKT